MAENSLIFDSLTHPTLSGVFPSRKGPLEASFQELCAQMEKSEVAWACAVGLDGVEGYEHSKFIAQCQNFSNLFPIAGFNPIASPCIPTEIAKLNDMGYLGIKLHPRFSRFTLLDTEPIVETLTAAYEVDLPVFLCTYNYSSARTFSQEDQILSLSKILANSPDTSLVLVHGGVLDVLKFSEFARHNPNLLIDLSFTLLKYEGSSLDHDISYLFKSFDKRMCIGSDFPDFSLYELRRRFNHFASSVKKEKAENIASQNLLRLFKKP